MTVSHFFFKSLISNVYCYIICKDDPPNTIFLSLCSVFLILFCLIMLPFPPPHKQCLNVNPYSTSSSISDGRCGQLCPAESEPSISHKIMDTYFISHNFFSSCPATHTSHICFWDLKILKWNKYLLSFSHVAGTVSVPIFLNFFSTCWNYVVEQQWEL